MDSAIQIQEKKIEQHIASYRDHIKKNQESATAEHAAVVTGLEEHNAVLTMRDSTREALNVA